MRKSKEQDRPLWQKLLDPVRPMYGQDPATDEDLLRRIVHDLPQAIKDNERQSRTIQRQARVLQDHGFQGY